MKRRLLFLLLNISFWTGIYAQNLARRAFLGVRMEAVGEERQKELKLPTSEGAYIVQVFDASSAKSAGLQAGDVLIKLEGKKISDSQDFIRQIKAFQTGDKVDLTFYRAAKQEKTKLELMGFPEESYKGVKLEYGAVQTQTGLQRSILSLPEGVDNPPVVFIIQGIDCSSIDVSFAPQGSYAQMIRHFSQEGYATFRVEKSGVGDSQGKACSECDFDEDKDIFLAALKSLKKHAAVNPEEVYLLGLSMGGVWAPLIAKEVPVKGVMAYGTISRPFAEYMLENSRRQAILGGVDFAHLEKSLKHDAQLYHHLYYEKLSPMQIIEKYPFLEARIREIASEKDPQAEIRHLHAGRLYEFQLQLQSKNISQAWKEVDSHVLAVWGKGDYVSNKEDHELIRDIVNFYHPGKGSFEMVDANHYFELAGNEKEAYKRFNEGPRAPLNPQVFDVFTNWMNRIRGV
ncbi:MAG: PDZ domain-containing protein [Bacteroidota bacterium]